MLEPSVSKDRQDLKEILVAMVYLEFLVLQGLLDHPVQSLVRH